MVAGVLAWASARALGEIVDAHEGIGHTLRIAAGFGGSPAVYPSARIAIIVAVIGAAAPYVTRPARVFGWIVVALLAASALYLGAAFPNDLFAGVLLGVTVASLVHLVFGSPGSRPTIPQITEALARLGVVAHDVQFAPEQPASSTLVLANDEQGPLRVASSGGTRLITSSWPSCGCRLVNKRSTGRFVLTREQEVEHEAYVMLVAAQGQVHVPTVVVAGRAGPRAALLVQRPVSGERLADLEVDVITDALLRRLWRDVAAMGRSRVVHGDLDADHVIVRGGQPWIVGFDDAVVTGDPRRPRRRRGATCWLRRPPSWATSARSRAAVAESGAAGGRAGAPAPATGGVVVQHPQAERCRAQAFADRLDTLRAVGAVGHRDRACRNRCRSAGSRRRARPWPSARSSRSVRSSSTSAIPVDVVRHDAERATGAGSRWRSCRVCRQRRVRRRVAGNGDAPVAARPRPLSCRSAMSFSNLAIPAIGGQGMQVRFLQKLGVDLRRRSPPADC